MKSIFLFGLFFLSYSSLPAQDFLHWLEGHWQGIGYQVPTDSTWPIDLTYNPNNQIISVKYPSLNCNGKWKFIKVTGKRAEFVEIIEEGKENCDNQVKVVVNYIDENFISVAYFLPKYSDDVVAHSVLRRRPGT